MCYVYVIHLKVVLCFISFPPVSSPPIFLEGDKKVPTKCTWDGSWSEILPLLGSEKIVFTETGEENCLERLGPGMVLGSLASLLGDYPVSMWEAGHVPNRDHMCMAISIFLCTHAEFSKRPIKVSAWSQSWGKLGQDLFPFLGLYREEWKRSGLCPQTRTGVPGVGPREAVSPGSPAMEVEAGT